MNVREEINVADKALVGRRVRWTVWGRTYEGTIQGVVDHEHGPYRKGDWFVEVDGGGYAAVIGEESKLI
jgi:hypothetical protein